MTYTTAYANGKPLTKWNFSVLHTHKWSHRITTKVCIECGQVENKL